MPKAVPVPENWAELPDEQLLDLRLCDLPIALAGSVMQGRIAELQAELDTRELRVPVHYYLAEEWFTPDGATSMAVPFYLAHPRLERLERTQMLEVEGGDYEWCMRILRHEAGHVVDNAWKLRRRRQRRVIFGRSSEPYPMTSVKDPKRCLAASIQMRRRLSCTFFSTRPFSQPAATLQKSGSYR
jgi:hypothetical protein